MENQTLYYFQISINRKWQWLKAFLYILLGHVWLCKVPKEGKKLLTKIVFSFSDAMENGDEKNTMKNRRGNGKRFSSPFFLKKCENRFKKRAFLENLISFP